MATPTIPCPNCKSQINLGAIFCRQCGTKLGVQVQPLGNNTFQLCITTPIQPPLTPPVSPTPSVIPTPSSKTFTHPVQPLPNARKWHKVLLLFLWLIVGVLLLFIPKQHIEIVNKPDATPTPSPGPLPPEVDPEGVYTSTITMPNGETGTFRIFLLSKRYVWVTGSKTEVEGLGDVAKKGKSAFSPELQESIRQAREVIVVGTADVRNKVESENARAGDRSRTLFEVVSKIKGNEYSVFNWNLGQWRGSSVIPLAEQRRIILIKVLSRTKGMDLKYGVRRTLEEHKTTQPIFGQMLNDYSKSRDLDMR